MCSTAPRRTGNAPKAVVCCRLSAGEPKRGCFAHLIPAKVRRPWANWRQTLTHDAERQTEDEGNDGAGVLEVCLVLSRLQVAFRLLLGNASAASLHSPSPSLGLQLTCCVHADCCARRFCAGFFPTARPVCHDRHETAVPEGKYISQSV